MSWDHVPEPLRSIRTASFCVDDIIGANLPAYAGTGTLLKYREVPTRHFNRGRTILGSAATSDGFESNLLYNFDDTLNNFDGGDYSLFHTSYHDNDAQLDTTDNPLAIGCGAYTGTNTFGMNIIQTVGIRTRFYSQIGTSPQFTYMDATGIGSFNEPLGCLMSINATLGETNFYYFGIDSETLWCNHTFQDVPVYTHWGFLKYTAAQVYTLTKPIQNHFSVFKGSVLSEADGMSIVQRIKAQRDYMLNLQKRKHFNAT